jgi:tRNA-2-methylthio-N6-dimethylallyladenosine synthase
VRPGTKAAEWPDQIPEPAKSRRLRRLSLLQQRISREMNEAQIGRVFEVLVDGPGEKPGQLKGLSRQNKTVHFDGPISRIGELVPVRAEQAFMWGFLGTEVI